MSVMYLDGGKYLFYINSCVLYLIYILLFYTGLLTYLLTHSIQTLRIKILQEPKPKHRFSFFGRTGYNNYTDCTHRLSNRQMVYSLIWQTSGMACLGNLDHLRELIWENNVCFQLQWYCIHQNHTIRSLQWNCLEKNMTRKLISINAL